MLAQRRSNIRVKATSSSPTKIRRRLPIGAEVQRGGGVHFRVWAPRRKSLAVHLAQNDESLDASKWIVKLQRESDGYFSAFVADAEPGMLYRFRLDSGREFPDPASRFQPQGPHGPSQIIDPASFQWTDDAWRGVSRKGQIIYEMHIGTFTVEGTWSAAQMHLPELAQLGITVLEIMPVADFPGRFGWGYDGVNMFAPTRLYGSPEDFKRFVNRAHECGLGVILDIVCNHVGPAGNYLGEFSESYFSRRYLNEWGEAINFDDTGCEGVREFFIANAAYWIDEYHLDGLRLDATQAIFDCSRENIMIAITRRVREAARGRATYVVAENEPQQTSLIRPVERGGYGMDALWNDDFHHTAMVACTGRSEAYYTDYKGTPQEFISALKWGYLYQGQWYQWQKKRRGTPALDLPASAFVTFIQNHDQIANSLRGQRIHQLCSSGRFRAITALLLLGPSTPMLFQGQEFGASTPFFYFADHNRELAKLVLEGRRRFLRQFPSIAAECDEVQFDPASEETFRSCKLDWSERERHADIYALHRDLLHLRRSDSVFAHPRRGGMDGAVLGAEAFVLRFFGESATEQRLLIVNLGFDLRLEPAPEPLLAPPEGCRWRLIWSSEDPRYGGGGTPAIEREGGWRLPAHSALVLTAEPIKDECEWII